MKILTIITLCKTFVSKKKLPALLSGPQKANSSGVDHPAVIVVTPI